MLRRRGVAPNALPIVPVQLRGQPDNNSSQRTRESRHCCNRGVHFRGSLECVIRAQMTDCPVVATGYHGVMGAHGHVIVVLHDGLGCRLPAYVKIVRVGLALYVGLTMRPNHLLLRTARLRLIHISHFLLAVAERGVLLHKHDPVRSRRRAAALAEKWFLRREAEHRRYWNAVLVPFENQRP
jgi:hypothetical protein